MDFIQDKNTKSIEEIELEFSNTGIPVKSRHKSNFVKEELINNFKKDPEINSVQLPEHASSKQYF